MTKCMQSYLSHLTVFLMQKFNAFLMFVGSQRQQFFNRPRFHSDIALFVKFITF